MPLYFETPVEVIGAVDEMALLAGEARDAANDAATEREQSQQARDASVAARDIAVDALDTTIGARDAVAGLKNDVLGLVEDAEEARDVAVASASVAWTPVFSIAADGERRVYRVHDWVGGLGAKPAINVYVSETGLTANIALATDIRGPASSADIFLSRSSNLSDLINAPAARNNLGLGNVNNTSDADKPVSSATQAALNAKADASAVTASLALKANTADVNTALAAKAPLASPALTGTPTAPTAATATNNTQIATTAFVKAALAALVGSAPAALDTLNELADALGGDPNFAATVNASIAARLIASNNLSDLTNAATARSNLQIGSMATRNVTISSSDPSGGVDGDIWFKV